MVTRVNLLPSFSGWTYRGNAGNTVVLSDNEWGISWTATDSDDYISYSIDHVSGLIGKKMGFSLKAYSVSAQEGDGRVIIRAVDSTGHAVKVVNEEKVSRMMEAEYSFIVPGCSYLRVEFSRHYSASFAEPCIFSVKSPCLWMWEEGDRINMLPYYGDSRFEGPESPDGLLVQSEKRTVKWTSTRINSGAIYCTFPGEAVAGKAFEFGFAKYISSPVSKYTRVTVRCYDSTGGYLDIVDLEGISGSYSCMILVPSVCTKLRIYFRVSKSYGSPLPDGKQTFTLEDYYLNEAEVAGMPLQIHKILSDGLPASVDARDGVTHLYFSKDPETSAVSQYITDQNGAIIPIGSAGGTQSQGYTNSYTMDHINERKQDIIDLTRNGNCITFAVATDIHVRTKDGDSGRYDQVKDFILLTRNLPIDYVICTGDILSYSASWSDCPFEPRLNKVRSIFDELRCPWFAVRGNHDYNALSSSDSDSVKVTVDNVRQMVITNKDWYRAVEYAIPRQAGFQYSFNFGTHNGGYYYVDDHANKHRMIFMNSDETIEDTAGNPYVKPDGSLYFNLFDFRSIHQIEWLLNQALDMNGKTDWSVSFFSHVSPYCDKDEPDGCSEFHGYGINNEVIAALIQSFKNGTDIAMQYTVWNKDAWDKYNINRAFSSQGAIKVIGWFSGHIHDDCHKKVKDVDYCVSTCTSASQRRNYSHDPEPQKLPPERNDTNYAMSVNVFIVNPAERKVNVVKVGSKRDNAVKTSSDYEFSY